MRRFSAFGGKGFIMEFAGGLWIQRQVKLVLPSELEPCLRDRVVATLRAGMAFGEIGGVGGDLVRDNAVFDVFLVRQAQMFFRRYVAKHGGAVPADHRRADRA